MYLNKKKEELRMFYETENEDLSLREFIETHKLPCLAMVKQGYYGNTIYNVLDTEQVLRIQGVYTEHRVYCKVLNDTYTSFGRDASTVSLPLTCDILMHVIRKGKLEKVSKSLRSVIAEFKLPIDVQLVPSDSTQCMVSSGNQRRAITGKVQLQLYERHKFHYIYGNPVCKDKLYGNVFSILLGDCDATLSLVTGLINGNKDYYHSLIRIMRNTVEAYIKFEHNIGHKDIFVAVRTFHQKKLNSKRKEETTITHIDEKPNPVKIDDDDEEHRYMELKQGTVRPEVGFRKSLRSMDQRVSGFDNSHKILPASNATYKYLMPIQHYKTAENVQTRASRSFSPGISSITGNDKTSMSSYPEKEGNTPKDIHTNQFRNPKEPTQQPIENNSNFNSNKSRPISAQQFSLPLSSRETHSLLMDSNKPPLPPRQNTSVGNAVQAIRLNNFGQLSSPSRGKRFELEETVKTPRPKESCKYVPTPFNFVENADASRPTHIERSLSTAKEIRSINQTSRSSHSEPLQTIANTNIRKVSCSSDVKALTIEELGHYLDILNLGRHSRNFAKDQVDGCLLQELDEQFLQNEFGFSRFEALKLTKFARSGYLPKT